MIIYSNFYEGSPIDLHNPAVTVFRQSTRDGVLVVEPFLGGLLKAQRLTVLSPCCNTKKRTGTIVE